MLWLYFLGHESSEVSKQETIVAQTPERHCKSLPTSPTSSPPASQKRLSRSVGRSAENLQVVTETDSAEPLKKKNLVKGSEVFKRVQEESAKTVDLEEFSSTETFEIPKDEVEVLDKISENQEANVEGKPGEDGAAPELSLRRPDNLKGLSPFQKSHGSFAGLGLAFSAQSGSAMARWPSLADKVVPSEDWENLTFSSAGERAAQKSESTPDGYVAVQ